MRYKFITFEGIEGCGKSTQSKKLYEYLSLKNYDAIITREPGGAKSCEMIRNILLSEEIEPLESKTETLLNFASRIEHVEKLIKPSLNKNKIVICDRFFDSTIAYQGYGFQSNLDDIEMIKKFSIDNFKPDITFLIDVSVESSFARIINRSTNNKYEKFSLEFHRRVRNGFLNLAKNNDRFVIINGERNIDEIFDEILKILRL